MATVDGKTIDAVPEERGPLWKRALDDRASKMRAAPVVIEVRPEVPYGVLPPECKRQLYGLLARYGAKRVLGMLHVDSDTLERACSSGAPEAIEWLRAELLRVELEEENRR